VRLREFRQVIPGQGFDTIPFDSVEGNGMVSELLEMLPQEHVLFDELLAAVDFLF
jgi:hypothetical protein